MTRAASRNSFAADRELVLWKTSNKIFRLGFGRYRSSRPNGATGGSLAETVNPLAALKRAYRAKFEMCGADERRSAPITIRSPAESAVKVFRLLPHPRRTK